MVVNPDKEYFAEHLAGEAPLRHETASRLCAAAAAIGDLAPWRALNENQLIAVVRKKGLEPDFVSVLGSGGEHRGIFVYPGIRGYAWWEEMAEMEGEAVHRHLLSENESLQANFADDEDLREPDAALLKDCGLALPPHGIRFRSVRRGYFPWYINEEEGRHLGDCLEALLGFLRSGALEADGAELWPEREPVMPLLSREGGAWKMTMLNMQLTRVNTGELWVSKEVLAALPAGRKSGALCLGDHILPGRIGLENERPAVLHLVAAMDNRTGYAYPPQFRTPGDLWGVGASKVLVEAMQVRGAVPETVFVTEPRHAELLGELASAVGFELKVRRRIPMLKELFHEMSKFQEGPPNF